MKSLFDNLKNSYNNFIKEVRGKINYKDPYNNPLHLAVMGDNLEEVLKVLSMSTLQDVRAYNANGQTPFNIAVSLGKSDIAREVMHHEALLDGYINPSYTPLHFAVMSGDIEEVRSVLEISTLGDIEAKSADNYRRTALDMAIELGRPDIALELVHHEALLVDLLEKVDTYCEQAEESLSYILAKLDCLDFPTTFITPAFSRHHHEDNSSSLSGESGGHSNC